MSDGANGSAGWNEGAAFGVVRSRVEAVANLARNDLNDLGTSITEDDVDQVAAGAALIKALGLSWSYARMLKQNVVPPCTRI